MSKFVVAFIENNSSESDVKELVKNMVAGGESLLDFKQAMRYLAKVSGDYKYGYYQIINVAEALS